MLAHLLGDAGSPYLIGLVSTALLLGLGWDRGTLRPDTGWWAVAGAWLNWPQLGPCHLCQALLTSDPQLAGKDFVCKFPHETMDLSLEV